MLRRCHARSRQPSDAGSDIGSDNMAFKNFKLETDADGIALVTWDMPGRSMNVIDDLGQRTRGDRRRDRRRRRHQGRASSPRARTPSPAAPTCPCCEGMRASVCRDAEEQGRGSAPSRCCSTRAAGCRCSIASSRPAASRGSPRSTALRSAARFELALACHYRVAGRQSEDPARPARSQGRPVPRRRRHAARRRASMQPQDALQMLLKGEQLNLEPAPRR